MSMEYSNLTTDELFEVLHHIQYELQIRYMELLRWYVYDE